MDRPRTRSWFLATGLSVSALIGGGLALAADTPPPESDFGSVLSEMRSAVAHTSDLRTRADHGGDRIKETCVYERLRGMMQAVDSAQVAETEWEGAMARGDQAGSNAEIQRAQEALTLVRQMRNEADNCIGKELALSSVANGATVVTVESNVREDDPNAGPVESWTVRPPRLELPEPVIAASPFTSVQTSH